MVPEDLEALGDIAAREAELYRALESGDADALLELLTPDASYIRSTSVAETREEAAAGQRSGVSRHGPTHVVDRRVRVFGELAVTDGLIDTVDEAHGDPVHVRLRQTLIWVRHDGAWRLLLRQATRVPI